MQSMAFLDGEHRLMLGNIVTDAKRREIGIEAVFPGQAALFGREAEGAELVAVKITDIGGIGCG